MSLTNPTENGKGKSSTTPCLTIEIKYHPDTRRLEIGGNCGNPFLFYAVMRLAEKSFDRQIDREDAAHIRLPQRNF